MAEKEVGKKEKTELEAKIDEIYSKISTKVSKDDFMKKYEEITDHFGDTISKDIALQLAAYTFGYQPKTKIAQLRNSKGEVRVVGTVLHAEVKEFKRKDGIGLVARIRIADDSGEATAVLWDEAAELVRVGDIFPGCEVELRGFVRKRDEGVEISVNDALNVSILEQKEAEVEGFFIEARRLNGELEIILVDSKGVKGLRFKRGLDELECLNASFGDRIRLRFFSDELINAELSGERMDEKKFFTDLSDVASSFELKEVNVRGRVSGIGMLRKIVRGERTIKYAEIFISDKTGRVRVLLWGERSGIFKEVDVGKEVLIFNARVKDGEIHCGSKSLVLIR